MKKTIIKTIISATFLLSPLAFAEMINLNTADATIIQENLKGVGEKKALAIVAYRDEHGAFQSIEDIMKVKGIGKGIFKKIQADLSLTEGLGINKKIITVDNTDTQSTAVVNHTNTSDKTKTSTVITSSHTDNVAPVTNIDADVVASPSL